MIISEQSVGTSVDVAVVVVAEAVLVGLLKNIACLSRAMYLLTTVCLAHTHERYETGVPCVPSRAVFACIFGRVD